MLPQPMICSDDVEATSRWYQFVLGCRSAHGGTEYDRLICPKNGRLILQIHRWEVEHHHGRIGNPDLRPYGNGVLLWFEIEDFDAAEARVTTVQAPVLHPRHCNPPDRNGGPNHWEIWIQDPNGYTVVLASPDGTADGDWRPEHG